MKETTKAWARKRGDKRIRQLEWILQAQAANQPTIAILRQTETETIEISRFLLIYVFYVCVYIYRRACCVLQPPFCYAQLPILMLLPPAIYPCLFDAFSSSSLSSTLFIDKLWIYEGRLNSSRFLKFIFLLNVHLQSKSGWALVHLALHHLLLGNSTVFV